MAVRASSLNIGRRVADIVTLGDYSRQKQMREALASAETTLSIDDARWLSLTPQQGQAANDLMPVERTQLVQRARRYAIQDPLCRQTLRLYTSYAVGRGMSIKAQPVKNGQQLDTDDTVQKNPYQTMADLFWKHPDNRVVFSTRGQHKNSDRFLTDGEIFFFLFPNEDTTRVRALRNCLEITDIIANPEDDSEPWYYVRRWSDVKRKSHVTLYPDRALRAAEELPQLDPDLLSAYHIPKGFELEVETFVKHETFNTIGLRGYPIFAAALDWAKVLRNFLENRATLSAAHAMIAWKRTVNGPAATVAAMASRTGTADVRTNVPKQQVAGQTVTQNKATDWEPVNAQTGGANAYAEKRNFTLQFCAAVGIPEHYFADGSMGTRSTSTMMERPVELAFTDYQTIWKAIYEDLFDFEIRERDDAWDEMLDLSSVRVDAPRILEDDTSIVVSSVVEAIGALPEFNIDEIILVLLNAFNLDDPQDLLPKIRKQAQLNYQQGLALAEAQAGLMQALSATVPGPAKPDGTPGDPIPDHSGVMDAVMTFVKALTPGANPGRVPGVQRGPQFGPGETGANLVLRKKYPKSTRPSD